MKGFEQEAAAFAARCIKDAVEVGETVETFIEERDELQQALARRGVETSPTLEGYNQAIAELQQQ